MKGLNRAVLILSKALEILHWGACTLMAFLIGMLVFARDWTVSTLEAGIPEFGTEVSTYGLELMPVLPDGSINFTMMIIFLIGAIITIALMAMVFRNVYLIIKTAEGRTKFSEGKTPFQSSIVRMTREIGIFLISTPVVGLIFSILAQVIGNSETVTATLSLETLIIGLFVLCLSQFFNYGKQLQTDVDGLL